MPTLKPVLFCEGLTAQGQWSAGFNHPNTGASVHPLSKSHPVAVNPAATPQWWITENAINPTTGVPLNVPGTRFQSIQLPAGVSVTQVVLVAPAAVTHHDDGGQRLVRLTTLFPDDSNPSSMHVLMPATNRHAPPGWYMLFVITNEGVPANAFFLNLG